MAESDGRAQAAAEAHGEPSRVEIDIAPAALAKVVALLFGIWLLARIWTVLVVLLFSLMLVATFHPLVRRLQRRVTRTWAIATVIVGTVLLLGVLVALVFPPLIAQAQSLINHQHDYARLLDSFAKQHGVPLRLEERTKDWTTQIASLGPQLITMFGEVVRGVTGVLTVAVLTIYLLIDGPRVSAALMRLLPRFERMPARQMVAEIAEQVGSYMRGQLLTSLLAGLFSLVLLVVFGVPEPLALAFLMAVADAVPMIGPLIGTVPAVLMAIPRGTGITLAVAAGYILYHQLESHILVPRIYGKTMRLPSSVVLISILIGAELLGILGAVLALPVAAAIPVILRFAGELRERREEIEADPSATAGEEPA